MHCPSKALFCSQSQPKQVEVYRTGIVEGIPVTDIVLDTGCSQTLVRSDLITDEDVLQEEVAIRCAHGNVLKYPLANIQLMIGATKMKVKAGVANNLPVSVLLGTDVPETMNLLQQALQLVKPKRHSTTDVLAVETRAQSRQNE